MIHTFETEVFDGRPIVSTKATSYFPEEAVAYVSGLLMAPEDSCKAPSSASASRVMPTVPIAMNLDTSREISDEDLIFQVGKGSKDALSVLFRRHARSVFNVAHRILRDKSEAEDLLQELFIFLFQKAKLFDEAKAPAVSWIIQMTYHRAIDRRRYLNVRHHYNVEEFNEERQPPATGGISIDLIAAQTLLRDLRDKLSPEQRQTLELHFFDGYTFHEIAERTGQALGNVRHHYYRGLERLRSNIFAGKTRLK